LRNLLLTASMIVRNEDHFLAKCLESIRHVVDEIVIVDTGSTDQTKTIAEKFGARVFEYPWHQNFSAARNEALKHSRGEWILYIDADERLKPINRSKVVQTLSDQTKIAFRVLFHPVSGYSAYREYRLFRNDARIRFKGVIHETIVPAIQSVADEDRLEIGKCDLTIQHTGYDGNQNHKHTRNLPLLKKQIENDPERIYCRWHLGVVLAGIGNKDGAEETWKNAVKIIREKKSVQPSDSLPYADLIRLQYKKGKDVNSLIEEALNLFPDQYLLIWIKGQILMDNSNYEEAIPLFEQLVEIDGTKLVGELAYDTRIFDVLSYDPLATCCYKLGRFKESAYWYSRAEDCDSDNLDYKIKRLFVGTKI